jgi:hypothetical protein
MEHWQKKQEHKDYNGPCHDCAYNLLAIKLLCHRFSLFHFVELDSKYCSQKCNGPDKDIGVTHKKDLSFSFYGFDSSSQFAYSVGILVMTLTGLIH